MNRKLSLAELLSNVFSDINENFQSTLKTYEAGQNVFSPRDPSQMVYCLLQGAVKLYRLNHRQTIFIDLLPPDSLFNLTSPQVPNDVQIYQARALTEVELLSLPMPQFWSIVQEHPELMLLVVRELSKRLLQAQEMIEIMIHPSPGFRLLRFLLILCRNFGVPTSEGIRIELKLTHRLLAEMTVAHRTTVTSLLNELKRQQLISITRKEITVRSTEGLRKASELWFREPPYNYIIPGNAEQNWL
ncbi:helix-turn-helix domain-containing protein [Pleurocapsales cyanobacterium LEGE 10410]|nr:helix-turn-helix domain-containing protein [Pleurocapsales cyanobacterium LEGE 10410]